MHVSFDIPDDLARRIGVADGLSRYALEALAAEEFRRGHLTLAELRRLLGFGTRDAVDGFLKTHDIYAPYTLADFDQEQRELERLGF